MGPCEDSGSTQAHLPSAPGMLILGSGTAQALLRHAQALTKYAHPQLKYTHP
jgi:hypothetical protein